MKIVGMAASMLAACLVAVTATADEVRSAAPVRVGVILESLRGPNGECVSRLVTHPLPRAFACIDCLSDDSGHGPVPAGDDTTVLWVDRDHRYAIAYNVAISGDGLHIFANWSLNDERVALYEVSGGSFPLWEYSSSFVWNYGRGLGSSYDGSHLAATTGGSAYDWSWANAAPNWTFTYPAGYVGRSAIVSKDGSRVAAAAQLDSLKTLFVFDPQTGDTVWTASFINSTGLQGLDISADGSIVAVTTYDTCFVFELGVQRGEAIPVGTPTSGNQYPAAISGDGSLLVTGDYHGRLKKYDWDGSNYLLSWTYQYPWGAYYNWICGKAISEDGSKILIGTLDFGDGSNYENSCAVLFDSNSNVPLWFCHRYGDMVQSVALSPDGSMAVAGSWGKYGGSFGDVISVFNTSDSIPIFSVLDDIDEPGSIFSVDVSDTGCLVAAGGKAVHARQMGNGGEVYAIRVSPTVGVGETKSRRPRGFVGNGRTPAVRLLRNYPNPFAHTTTILYSVASAVRRRRTAVNLSIYDLSGRLVRILLDEQSSHPTMQQYNQVVWDGTDSKGRRVVSGVYVARLKAGRVSATRRLVVLR